MVCLPSLRCLAKQGAAFIAAMFFASHLAYTHDNSTLATLVSPSATTETEENLYLEPPETDEALIDEPPKAQALLKYKVAIIIDDLGYNKAQGLQALELPGEITYAFIPHSPNARFLAEHAQALHKEVMLHAPMSSITDAPLGENGLTDAMEMPALKAALSEAIASVPYIKGVNNHMGSLLTQQEEPMAWVMDVLSQHGLYFIDSRTSPRSIAWRTAQQQNIPSLKRDVFLDHQKDSEFMNKQFNKLIRTAKLRGYAVGIGHPYPETLEFLNANLSRLSAAGIELVPASKLVFRFSPNARQIQAKM